MKLFLPNAVFDTVFDITPEYFSEKGITAVIFDIDDTLEPFDAPLPSAKTVAYLKSLIDFGIKISLVSNGSASRVQKFNSKLNLFALHRAFKPRKKSLRAAMHSMGAKPETTAFVGDQIFTDICGGNRMRFYTILTNPIKPNETKFIVLKRKFEKLVIGRAGVNKFIQQKNVVGRV